MLSSQENQLVTTAQATRSMKERYQHERFFDARKRFPDLVTRLPWLDEYWDKKFPLGCFHPDNVISRTQSSILEKFSYDNENLGTALKELFTNRQSTFHAETEKRLISIFSELGVQYVLTELFSPLVKQGILDSFNVYISNYLMDLGMGANKYQNPDQINVGGCDLIIQYTYPNNQGKQVVRHLYLDPTLSREEKLGFNRNVLTLPIGRNADNGHINNSKNFNSTVLIQELLNDYRSVNFEYLLKKLGYYELIKSRTIDGLKAIAGQRSDWDILILSTLAA